MFTVIMPHLWMMVPKEERDILIQQFGLVRTGITEVIDQQLITDGYSDKDLAGITLEKMTEFIGSEESFMRAWELTVMKARAIANPPTVFIGTQEQLNEKLMDLKEVSNEEFEKLTGEKIEGQHFDVELLTPKVEKEIKKGKNKNV